MDHNTLNNKEKVHGNQKSRRRGLFFREKCPRILKQQKKIALTERTTETEFFFPPKDPTSYDSWATGPDYLLNYKGKRYLYNEEIW